MEIKFTIKIATDFYDNPGARDREDGDHSGQEFYEEILLPHFLKAMEEKFLILIDLDGLWGCPSSFVSGSFGKLSMEYTSETVLKHLRFKSNDNPMRQTKIEQEIQNPTPKK